MTVISYRYNANNQRVAKIVNGQVVEKYLWGNLTTLLAIYDKDDNLKQRFKYTDGRMPVAMTDSNGTKHYLHYDQVGTLKAISNTNGSIIKEITYDTFGNILTDSNPSFTVPFGFAGGLYDSDTKLTRFGYRDYDAYTGKWTAKDPIGFDGGDSNLYGYVLGDPVDFVDPSGLLFAPNAGSTSSNTIKWWNNFFNGSGDFLDNYKNMRDANTIGADKYFHCMANCQASNRGDGGWTAANWISDFREWYQEPFDGPKACEEDQEANRQGRKGGNCQKTCERLRPPSLDSKW